MKKGMVLRIISLVMFVVSIIFIACALANPAFESGRVKNGMEYRINDRIAEVVFGIAWATDYDGIEDVRVWFAADPTVYFKTVSEK